MKAYSDMNSGTTLFAEVVMGIIRVDLDRYAIPLRVNESKVEPSQLAFLLLQVGHEIQLWQTCYDYSQLVIVLPRN